MPAPASYHHGHLRESLVEAAIEVARERGPEGLALRDLARRVGVSHNAAYRHFADRDALVAEVALRAMAGLVAAMQARLRSVTVADPVLRARRRLAEIGRGYVEFALSEPGLFRVAFSSYPDSPQAPDLPEATDGAGARDDAEASDGTDPKSEVPLGGDPFGLLNDALDALVQVGFLHPDARLGAEIMCWSAVHGFAVLHLDGPLSREADDVREQSLSHVLATIDRGYAATTGTPVGPGDLLPVAPSSTPEQVGRGRSG